MNTEDKFTKILQELLPSSYSKEQIDKFSQYLELMAKWNKAYNLTAIKSPREMVIRHILDSLPVADYLKGPVIIDVGTGAGLPGIPLAIIQSDNNFILLDSNGKKTQFLTQVLLNLDLKNVVIVQKRAENFIPDVCFNTVISRAFASISKMLMMTKHLCCKEGIFLVMKGNRPQQELTEVPKEFIVKETISLKVPYLEADRHLVCVEFSGR